jgi:ATP synthase protein I
MTAEPQKPEEKNSNTKAYLKYSGMAFQMMAVMLLAAYGGQWLDDYFGNDKPWYTLVLLLIGVVASIYITIKTVTSES